MLRHPSAADLFLLEVADLDGPGRERWPGAAAILDWARGYLGRPHPEVGRPGPVCPYVPASLRHSQFYVTERPGRPTVAGTAEAVMGYRDWFLGLRHADPTLSTILVLFPDVPVGEAPTLIDATQRLLKPRFVEEGLMVGEFHPLPPDVPGLWNADFRPLRSPVPLLAIRRMVANDLPFLLGDAEFLRAWLRRFGEASVPERCRERLVEALAVAS